MQPYKKLGIIGCGTMGRLIARQVGERLADLYRLEGVCSRTRAHAEALSRETGGVTVMEPEALIAACDVLVEASAASVMPSIVRSCLAARKEVITLSVGGFSLDPALLREVEASETAVHVPSGAMAGLDGLQAMREMGLDSVTLTTVKHPRSLGDVALVDLPLPTAAELGFMSGEARLLFDGTAGEAIRRFPANVNVAVAVGLAGVGFSRTRLRLFADPRATGTLHRLAARAGDCALETFVRPSPLRENPRSSALAMYSVPALLRSLAGKLKVAG